MAETSSAVQPEVLYDFTYGISSYSALALAPDGILYGTAVSELTGGIIFKITTNGVFTTIATLDSTNGVQPYGAPIVGADGNLYGVAWRGGASDYGTVFKCTPGGTLTKLADYSGTNGANPWAALVQTEDGLLYGVTENGGAFGNGAVFRVTTNGVLTCPASFSNFGNPRATLSPGRDGSLYGVAIHGGNYGNGSIFRVTTNGVLTDLVHFNGTNGAFSSARLTLGANGDFYGTTILGGDNGRGTVFRLSTNGDFTTLYSFEPVFQSSTFLTNTTGASPYASPTPAGDGFLYGTTFEGGTAGYGALYRISTAGEFTCLYSFDRVTLTPPPTNDFGSNPWGGLTLAFDGNLYGTTFNGGRHAFGNIFRLRPGAANSSLLLSLQPGPPGSRSNFLSCAGSPRAAYALQTATNPITGPWTSLCTNYADTNGQWSASDLSVTNAVQFYRILVP